MISKKIKQQNLAKITRQAQAEACKRDYYTFIREFWSEIVNDPFKPNWHIPYLCDELTKMLTRVADRKPKLHDLVVNVPPGTTKSLICTVMLPAWVWAGEWWWMRLIKASYSATLSTEQADLTRDIVQSEKYKHYFPQVRIKKGSDAKSHYKVVHWDKKRKMWQLGGGLMSTSVGAAVTGFHAHVRLTDDPLDPNSSHSIVKLNAANKWLDQNYSSRVVDKAETPHIMIMQRVDKGDPSGVLIDRKEQGKRVQHICLPGEIHTAENRERVSPPEMLACYDAQGGYLDPVRLNKEMILDMTIDLGRDGKAAQVDQNPQSRSGGMFKDADFKIIKGFDRSQITRSIRYWDKACLCAGTLITTDKGSLPIEQITAGMKVKTRQGYKKVQKAWLSKYINKIMTVVFSNGTYITGTPDHLVACGDEWVELQDLTYKHNIITGETGCTPGVFSDSTLPGTLLKIRDLIYRRSRWQENEIRNWRNGFSKGLDIPGKEKSDISKAIPGDLIVGSMSGRCTIEKSINTTKGVFPLVTISTIKTETGITTNHRILKQLAQETIQKFTWRERLRILCHSVIQSIGKGHKDLLLKKHRKQKNTFVKTVNKSSMQKATKRYTVQPYVESGIVPVYDLKIKSVHEFYANGVLVHNSTEGGGCFTAGVLMHRLQDGIFVVEDLKKGQWAAPEREKQIKRTAILDGKEDVIVWVEQEPGSGGKESAENTIRNLAGWHVYADKVSGAKEVRAEPYAIQAENGNIKVLNKKWTKDFLDRHEDFPNTDQKDEIDAAAGALNKLAEYEAPNIRVIG